LGAVLQRVPHGGDAEIVKGPVVAARGVAAEQRNDRYGTEEENDQ
jgi:hypothetical protein